MFAHALENMFVILISFAIFSLPTNRTKHWGLILTDSYKKPTLHHASNRNGPWIYEERNAKPDQSMSLIVLIRVGKIKTHSRMRDVIKGIAADGNPSQRTGEAFTCRIWVKDVLMALHDYGEIVLPMDISKFMITT